MTAVCVYTDKLCVTACLLSCLPAATLLNLTSVAGRILYLSPTNSQQSYFTLYKNDTVTKVPHFSKLCNDPPFHDVKVRQGSVNSTLKSRASAILLMILVRGCPAVTQHSWQLHLKWFKPVHWVKNGDLTSLHFRRSLRVKTLNPVW
jgi:hypothetical protein